MDCAGYIWTSSGKHRGQAYMGKLPSRPYDWPHHNCWNIRPNTTNYCRYGNVGKLPSRPYDWPHHNCWLKWLYFNYIFGCGSYLVQRNIHKYLTTSWSRNYYSRLCI